MQQNAYIAGVGMTPFGKHMDRTLKSLAVEAVEQALKDADLEVVFDVDGQRLGNALRQVIGCFRRGGRR